VSNVGKELSFQVKTMSCEQTYVPFHFEKKKSNKTRAWMANNYMKAFRDNAILRIIALKTIVKNSIITMPSFQCVLG